MSKKPLYASLLVLGLLGFGVVVACSAILDLDSLTSKPKADSGVVAKDLLSTGEAKKPVDLGRCISGAACDIPGKKGVCAQGKQRCFEGTTQGICEQVNQPGVEGNCTGKDNNCDGVTDRANCPAGYVCKYVESAWTCSGTPDLGVRDLPRVDRPRPDARPPDSRPPDTAVPSDTTPPPDVTPSVQDI